MRNLFLLSTLFLLIDGVAIAQDRNCFFTVDGGQVTSVSPNGKYVVGINPNASLPFLENGYESFLWDSDSNNESWLTEMTDGELEKSGYFTDVNDKKVIAGYFKDPAYCITITEWEGDFTLPVNVAAIWSDGVVTSLGIGDFELADFSNFNDGSIATAISDDGKTVVGFITLGNYAYTYPCVWRYDEASDDWIFTLLEMPEGFTKGQAMDVSGDGDTIVGFVASYGMEDCAILWDVYGNYEIFEPTKEDEDFNGNRILRISNDGKYAAIVMGGAIAVSYDINSKKYFKTECYTESGGVDIYGISDDGNIVGAYRYGNFFIGTYTRPFVYSSRDNMTLDFDYYMSLYAPDIEPEYSFSFENKITSVVGGISADGRTIAGTNGIANGWILQTESDYVSVPQPTECVEAVSCNLKEVTVTWRKDEHVYEGLTLKSYNIYCDGIVVANVPASETVYVHKDTSTGYLQYAVSSVFENESGQEIESPKSDLILVCVPDTYELPFFDNFETGTEQTNYWSEYLLVDNDDFFNFGCPMYTGFLDNCALYTSVSTTKDYSYAIVSRPMDATDEDNVQLSYAICRYPGSFDEIGKDSISFELSTDRRNWNIIKTYVADGNRHPWTLEKFDISEDVSGKVFQIRIRIHGEGKSSDIYQIDLFKVGEIEEYEAPEGLSGTVVDDKVNLIWKNSLKAYGLDYLGTPYKRLTVGDEGNTFIAANSFPIEDLKVFKDKYLTSVRTFVSHNTELKSKDTHASIVIFEDDELVREQKITNLEYNKFIVVPLDEPLVVDAEKELKVGLKIFDYDPQQIPIVYQYTEDFVKGRSDLYSQDDGKTWLCLSDFFATVEGHETDGYCCWEITANITDEPEPVILVQDDKLQTYNVYRNGELLNDDFIYNLQTRFTDKSPVDNATYTVVAFYNDGSFSMESNEYKVGNVGVESVVIGENIVRVYPNPAIDYINIEGDFENATLLNLNGQTIFMTTNSVVDVSSLSPGIYLMKIKSDENRTSVCKVVIN